MGDFFNLRIQSLQFRNNPQARFELQYLPDPNSGCWLWIGKCNLGGYGIMRADGKRVLAHRYALGIHKTKDKNICALHKCDNPTCVNPDHLYVGNRKDNADDKVRRGRHPKLGGTLLNSNKLTDKTATAVFYAEGTYRDIGEKFGIDCSQVSQIKNGKAWKHLKLTGEGI